MILNFIILAAPKLYSVGKNRVVFPECVTIKKKEILIESSISKAH